MDNIQKQRPNINFHKYYDSIFTVVWKEFYRVFLWLYKGGTQNVGEYLRVRTTPNQRKKFGIVGIRALDRQKPSAFDINLYYHLLQHTCGLAEDTSRIWTNPQNPTERKSLEHILYLLKQKRNVLCHKPERLMRMTGKKLDKLLIKLRQLCTAMIQEAGRKALKTNDQVTECVKNMENALKDIKALASPSEYTATKFSILARHEILKSCQTPSPSTSLFTMPLLHNKGTTIQHEMALKNFALWRSEDGSLPDTILLTGDSGTGKSTISRFLFDSWLFDKDEIQDIQNFDLVVPVQCNRVGTRDQVDFLQELFQNTIYLCGRHETRKFINDLKILWLVDDFEEGTPDARELLKLICKTSSSHLVFVTAAPHYQSELIELVSPENKVCEVKLSRFSEEEVMSMTEKLLQEKLNDTESIEIQKHRFLEDVKGLGDEIYMEIQIPLKLELMLNLWLEGKMEKGSDASFFQLYTAIMEVQVNKLKEKLKNQSTLKESEISKRIEQWVHQLYKTIYEMTMRKVLIRIDNVSQRNLEDKAGTLPINTEEILTNFLRSQTDCASRKISYFLIHNSQQYFLAAQHVYFSLISSPKPHEVLRKMFSEKLRSLSAFNRYHIYMLLLNVVSIVTSQKVLEQPLAEILIQLLYKTNIYDVLEVVQHSSYSEIFLKKACLYADERWNIVDYKVKAAFELLKHMTPKAILIGISNDPKSVTELRNLLEIIAHRNILVTLFLEKHCSFPYGKDLSDSYLAPISALNSKCNVIGFLGQLSLHGCRFLSTMSKIRVLVLSVSSNEILDEILKILNCLCYPDLRLLYLHFTMPIVKTSVSLYRLKLVCFMMVLNNLDESQLDETAQSLSHIYHKYNAIFISTKNISVIHDLNYKLAQRNVEVETFGQVSEGVF